VKHRRIEHFLATLSLLLLTLFIGRRIVPCWRIDCFNTRIPRLVETITNPVDKAWLFLELATVAIVARPLVLATYKLEGDGPLGIIAFDELENLKTWFNIHMLELTFPGLPEAISVCVNELAPISYGNDVFVANVAVTAHVRTLVQGPRDYFFSRIFGMLAADVAIYRTLRFANPIKFLVNHLSADVGAFQNAIHSLCHFQEEEVAGMIGELARYEALVNGYPRQVLLEADEVSFGSEFWINNRLQLPHLESFARYAFTVATSSAAVERVFSILKRCFKNEQRLTLEDYVQLSCMRQFNRKSL
jgi:hypothetical protein